MGILDPAWPLSDRDPAVPAWDDVDDRQWQTRRMEVYAAQVERMDRGIGTIVTALETTGVLDDTLVIFLSDNGGCAEELRYAWADQLTHLSAHRRAPTRDGRRVRHGNSPEVLPGSEDTFASYGRAWANLSNTPFREYKHWVHEGGIATPLIAHWPAGGIEAGTIRHQPHQLTDVMATVLEITGARYATSYPGRDPLPLEGTSMLPTWRGDPTGDRTLYFEHEGNAAVRRGTWKLVRKYPGAWELFNLSHDRTELNDLATEHPDIVTELAAAYEKWADRCGVIPRVTLP
jgi:arylsulfatase A-like enzyme